MLRGFSFLSRHYCVFMKRLLKNEFFGLTLSIFLIFLGVWLLNIASAGKLIGSVINSFVAPLQAITNKVESVAAESLKKKRSEESYKDEINQLRDELRKLRTLTADYYDVKRENAQFLKFYNLKKQDKSLEFVIAAVVSKSPGDLFGSFTINKGYNTGIAKNAIVMTESGIVGRIADVTAESSKVVTIFSPDFKASALDVVSGDLGIASGNFKLFKDNLLGIFYLPSQNNIKAGDVVATTGMGGIFPKNLPIGKVRELKQDDFDSSCYAIVEPFINLRDISEVFVVTDFAGKER